MVSYPAACCRNCGTAIASLSCVRLVTPPEGRVSFHLTTTIPCTKFNPDVLVKPHHNAGEYFSFGTLIKKISKVYCRVCDQNLGNVQQFVQRKKNTISYHNSRWHLKTKNVGFRLRPEDDESVVHVLPRSMSLTKFVNGVGIQAAVRELPIQLPEEHCAYYKPGGVFELEGALEIAPDSELDDVLEKLANARIDNPKPPSQGNYSKKMNDITLSVVAERPPRRRPPRSDELRQSRYETTANRQADEHEALTQRGEILLCH